MNLNILVIDSCLVYGTEESGIGNSPANTLEYISPFFSATQHLVAPVLLDYVTQQPIYIKKKKKTL